MTRTPEPHTPALRGDLSGPHSPVTADKAQFLHAVLAGLTESGVNLATDLSGYGEGGWHEAHGELDDDDALVIALTAYYHFVGAHVPASHLIWQEARFLHQDRSWQRAPAGTRSAAVADLARSLQHAWCEQTAVDAAQWRRARHHPSTGQCAITALVVQDRFGGHILRAPLADGSHYYNALPGGDVLDLTRDQFDRYEPVGPAEVRTREYLLSNAGTAARYALLLERLPSAYR